ncbi:MAG: sugar-binding transcriptional regulator [Pseudomonadota bacterium]
MNQHPSHGTLTTREQNNELMARAAHQHFVLGLTQSDVAKRLGITKFKAHRLIATARERGLVRIQIDIPTSSRLELERRLSLETGLETVVITPSDHSDAMPLSQVVGQSAASFVSEIISDNMTVAVSWGVTLRALSTSIEPAEHNNLSIVPMIGSLSRRSSLDRFDASTVLAQKLGAECYYLPGPLICDSHETKTAINAQPILQQALELARNADLALVSIGGHDFSSLDHAGVLSQEQIDSARAAGAIGNYLGQFIDRDGELIDHEINRLGIGVSLAESLNIKNRIMIAGGPAKVAALKAIIGKGMITGLITDEDTATCLLDT